MAPLRATPVQHLPKRLQRNTRTRLITHGVRQLLLLPAMPPTQRNLTVRCVRIPSHGRMVMAIR